MVLRLNAGFHSYWASQKIAHAVLLKEVHANNKTLF